MFVSASFAAVLAFQSRLCRKIYIHSGLFLSTKQHGVSYICHQPCAIELFRHTHTHTHLHSGLGLRLFSGAVMRAELRAQTGRQYVLTVWDEPGSRLSSFSLASIGAHAHTHTRTHSVTLPVDWNARWLATEVSSEKQSAGRRHVSFVSAPQ